jgi:hypothetical protein
VAIVVSQRLAFVRAKQLSDVQDTIAGLKEAAAKDEQDRIGKDLADAVARAKEADARIAEAERESAEANARATKAQESLGLAEQHAAEANVKAEGFRLDIAKANEGAARANETAERERLARLQLEARLADRTLTPAQQLALRGQLTAISGITVDVVVWGETPEVQTLSGLVLDSMAKAGWSINSGQAVSGGAAVRGILVGVRDGSDANTVKASNILVSALRSVGLVAGLWPFEQLQRPSILSNSSYTGTAPIRMFIGSKP